MTTTKTRINISIPKDVKRALSLLAKRDQMPEATKATHLLERALEIEEHGYCPFALHRLQSGAFCGS